MDLKRWLDYYGYDSPFSEEFYDLIEFPDGSKKIELLWRGIKKKTPYFTYEIIIEWLLVGVNDIEIEIEGKKTKRQKGDFDIYVKSNIIKKGSNSLLRSIYEKFIISKRIDYHIMDLYETTIELQEWIKEYFNQYV